MSKTPEITVSFSGPGQRFCFESKDWLNSYIIEFIHCYTVEMLLSWIVRLMKREWFSEQVARDFVAVYEKVTGQKVMRDILPANSIAYTKVEL